MLSFNRVGIFPLPPEGLYSTIGDLQVNYKYKGEKKTVIVPSGFKTDGASIPRLLWEEVGSPFTPEFITAAIVHDYCCVHDYDVAEMSDLFRDILVREGVSDLKAGIMHHAVYIYKTIA